jgi:hypothetical protein
MAKKQELASGFKKPKEIPLDEKMIPVSARVPESVSNRLNKEARESGHPVAKLLAHAICAYAKFLDQKESE